MSNRHFSKRHFFLAAAAAAVIVAGSPAGAQMMNSKSEKTVNVGGAPMYPSKNIVQNASTQKITRRSSPL